VGKLTLPKQGGALEIFLNSLVIAYKNHSKVVPVHAMRAYVGVEVLLHSDLGTRGDEWSFLTYWLSLGKETHSTYLIEDRMAAELVWFLSRRNFFPQPGIKPRLLAVVPLNYLLQQLCYPYSYSRSYYSCLYDCILKLLKLHIKVFETVEWHVVCLPEDLMYYIITLFYLFHTT
jgi:hypothetical protein